MQLVFSFSTYSNWPFGVNTRGCGQLKNVDIFQNLYLFQEAYLYVNFIDILLFQKIFELATFQERINNVFYY